MNIKNIAVVILNVMFLSATAFADEGNKFGIDHILGIQTPSAVTVSPDGEWVAYVVSRNDEEEDKGYSQIWMTSVDGKTTIPMTASYLNAGSPQWNPDGSSLGFIGTRGKGDDAKSQVWLLDRRGGEAQQYTHVEQGVSGFLWSPDGSKMLLSIKDPEPKELDENGEEVDAPKEKPFVIDRLQFKRDYVGYLDRRRTHLYLHNGDEDPIQITAGDYDNSDPKWSPDGSKIAFVSKREGDPDGNSNSDIWVVTADPDAGEYTPTQITKNKGSDSSPAWSPDGKWIAHITITEPEKLWYATSMLAVIASDGSGKANILTKDYDYMVYRPSFSKDGQSIYFLPDEGGNGPLMSIGVNGGDMTTHTNGEITVRDYDVGQDGTIATIQSSHHIPHDVHVLNDGMANRITTLNDELLDGIELANVERLKVPGWNDEPVESFVYYPPNYDSSKAYPTIFVLHGGPVSQHDTAFDTWGQLYAANGYIAVLPNPHGSTGYGSDFTYSLNRQWGVPDFADVDKIADYLVANGISDDDRLGVGGWSYGGILTNYVITQSGRFKGAVTGASEVNHRANYGHDHYQLQWEIEFGLPWENIDAWEAINPFNNIGKITTPTLVMGGQLDWNVPIQNSEQLYQGLKRLGIDTQLIVYPNEHHGIRRPSFQRDRLERFLGWYDKYVIGQ
ncbi:S9 family peptidase [Pseudemcibacter aquimaris]|uniref:S9 family peptidase n=1 Tax=Pseudemcibacter aquimaris TaxID=2857064 RepID=UPI002010E7E1|nr:S9 family peptidase [Pseudemcibacter aquimaris]MCC3862230.1 S9 family peptidase [Pseudemcibacter aquimaris]WDU58982.1 S9 family peptidase [Pseudemcibacter aquimaris]